jgi:hypothetical protein
LEGDQPLPSCTSVFIIGDIIIDRKKKGKADTKGKRERGKK